jgi:hypothetical protein
MRRAIRNGKARTGTISQRRGALQVGSIPIGLYLFLGLFESDRFIADQFVELILEPVFFVGAGVTAGAKDYRWHRRRPARG